MSGWSLTTSALSPIWRDVEPEIDAGTLLSVDAITDTWARRLVARARRRWDLLYKAPAITDVDAYIASASQPGTLKGFCFVAADEIAVELAARGADAKCVHVVPKKGGGDHYFTVVRKGGAKTSLVVDATWVQFALAGQPFCLVGTLDTLKPVLKRMKPGVDLAGAYAAGLEVVDQWSSFTCFP